MDKMGVSGGEGGVGQAMMSGGLRAGDAGEGRYAPLGGEGEGERQEDGRAVNG